MALGGLDSLLAPYRQALSPYQEEPTSYDLSTDPIFGLIFGGGTPQGALSQLAQREGGGGGGGAGGVGGSPSANERLGRSLAEQRYDWSGRQANALDRLWTRESGWNEQADNPSSSAFGIPQAMTSVHHPGRAYMQGDPRAQILWGLRYITQRYGSPLAAWQHSQQTGWY